MIIVLVLIVFLAIGWWVYQDTQNYEGSLDKLVESGFEIDHTLKGRPSVVFDDDTKRLAFVSANRNTLYRYDQVLGWEWGSMEKPGWNDNSEADKSYYVDFYMQYEDEPTIKVEGISERDVKLWRDRLNKLLQRNSAGSKQNAVLP
jgi:hypothetical protein